MWLLLCVVLGGTPQGDAHSLSCPTCHEDIPHWLRAPVRHWYRYRMGCSSACRHCQSVHRDWLAPELDYHNRHDYPWFSLRRTVADGPEVLWPLEVPVVVPGKTGQRPKPKRSPVLGPSPWGPWAPPFFYDPQVQVRY